MSTSAWRLAAPLLVSVLTVPVAAQAPGDPAVPDEAQVYLQGPGLQGDATLNGFQGWIPLEDCSASILSVAPGQIVRRLDVSLRNDQGLVHLFNAAFSDPEFEQLRLAWVVEGGSGASQVATGLLTKARLTDLALGLDDEGLELLAGFSFEASKWTAPVLLPGDDSDAGGYAGQSFGELLLSSSSIQGESVLQGYQGWSEARRLTLAVDSSGPFPLVSTVSGTLRMDSTWPQWVAVVVEGEVLRETTAEVVRFIGDKPHTVFRLKLERTTAMAARVSSDSSQEHETALELSVPERLSWEYVPLDPATGESGEPITGCYDVVRNEDCSR